MVGAVFEHLSPDVALAKEDVQRSLIASVVVDVEVDREVGVTAVGAASDSSLTPRPS
jgi:hypothetical protein